MPPSSIASCFHGRPYAWTIGPPVLNGLPRCEISSPTSTREGKLWMSRKDIDRVIQAEKPDGTGKVLTDAMLAKYIPNYTGSVKQQKLGREVVTRLY
ncbi:hypothetical protein LTS07_004585 [Exophiala sideris]|nr:hypothetical protein LTS07_004585 [Exophiala sideris]KAK5040893.1 hypothetical protein LTR13_003194 [Exophiala sideris]